MRHDLHHIIGSPVRQLPLRVPSVGTARNYHSTVLISDHSRTDSVIPPPPLTRHSSVFEVFESQRRAQYYAAEQGLLSLFSTQTNVLTGQIGHNNYSHASFSHCQEFLPANPSSCLPCRHSGVIDLHQHTPSIAFRHPPPNSVRFSYATEGILFISAQLSSDAVSALRKVRVVI